MEFAGNRIVMTGVTGFIGRHVAELLLEQGAEVYGLVRTSSAKKDCLPKHKHFHILYGSLREAAPVLKQVQAADAFFHFAWGGVNRGEIDSRSVQEENIAGSLECLRAARQLGCRIFMDAGSRVEYGITENGVMSEEMECCPVNEYGRAKLLFYRQAAVLCRQWSMTYYHLRFFSVYGIGDHPWSIISTLVRELPKGQTVSLSACLHKWNFMEISDAARAVAELYRRSEAREGQIHVVNVASTDTRQLRSFVEEIYELCGKRGKLEYGSFVQAKEGALSLCPTVEVLKELTDRTWDECVTFSRGIQNMLKESEL